MSRSRNSRRGVRKARQAERALYGDMHDCTHEMYLKYRDGRLPTAEDSDFWAGVMRHLGPDAEDVVCRAAENVSAWHANPRHSMTVDAGLRWCSASWMRCRP